MQFERPELIQSIYCTISYNTDKFDYCLITMLDSPNRISMKKNRKAQIGG